MVYCRFINSVAHFELQQKTMKQVYALGLPQTSPIVVHSSLVDDLKISKIAAGRYHQLLLTEDHQVFLYGSGRGMAPFEDGAHNITSHLNLKGHAFIVDIATKGFHNLLLTNNGIVISFGENYSGQCGYMGVRGEKKIAILDQIPDTICCIATGISHSIVASENRVYGFGSNELGELGLPDIIKVTTPCPVPFFEALLFTDTRNNGLKVKQVSCACTGSLVLLNNGDVYLMGLDQGINYSPIRIGPTLKAKQIASGDAHHALVTFDGHLYTWGNNNHGQLGRLSTWMIPSRVDIPKVNSIGCGAIGAMAITEGGSVMAWGYIAGSPPGGSLEPHLPTELPCFEETADETITHITGSRHYMLLYNSNRHENDWLAKDEKKRRLRFAIGQCLTDVTIDCWT